MIFGFLAASRDEKFIYGSERPGYPEKTVSHETTMNWLGFMKNHGIKRVCCLLTKDSFDDYDQNLLTLYDQYFGNDKTCWAPIKDFHLADSSVLTKKILPFLEASALNNEHVVVHCAGGKGRTGHVLAAWLVFKHQYSIEQALSEVISMGRSPYEAIEMGNATHGQLVTLLAKCNQSIEK